MKKIIAIVMVLAMIFSINIASYAENSQTSPVMATVRNTLTGEMDTYIATPVNVSRAANSDGTISSCYEVFIPLPCEKNARDSSSSSQTTHGVRATIGVDYVENSQSDEYKATRFYGSWEPEDSIYYITDRRAAISPGLLEDGEEPIIRNPTSNTFSYYTGWGYLPKQPNSDYQQNVNSQAYVWVSGMEYMGAYEIALYHPFASY